MTTVIMSIQICTYGMGYKKVGTMGFFEFFFLNNDKFKNIWNE